MSFESAKQQLKPHHRLSDTCELRMLDGAARVRPEVKTALYEMRKVGFLRRPPIKRTALLILSATLV